MFATFVRQNILLVNLFKIFIFKRLINAYNYNKYKKKTQKRSYNNKTVKIFVPGSIQNVANIIVTKSFGKYQQSKQKKK